MKPTVVAFELGHTQSSGLAGGDVILERLSPLLVDRFDLHVVLPSIGADHWRGRPAQLHVLSEKDPPRGAFGIWRRYKERIDRAVSLVERDLPDIDLLYSSTDVWPDVRAAQRLAQRGAKRRWVGRVHHLIPLPFGRIGSPVRNLGSYVLQQRAIAHLAVSADLVIALNDLLVPRLIAKGVPEKKLRVLGPGIPLEAIARAEPDANTPRFDAVFVGRLHRTKGVFDLIPIWERVVRRARAARLGIIGEGDERTALETMIRSSGLADRIELLGFLSDEAKWRTLKSSKLFLAPDREAGFGIAIAEAMACGLAVVAWDLPAYGHLYPNGLVAVPHGDVDAFADAVATLLGDAARHRGLAGAAQGVAATFGLEGVARSLGDWFSELLLSAPRR